ncbi:HERC1 [Symbiodinium necroappetens]|uniref:HERC1 protein n=1 Tax=Symbiodinium necroappetens TaxID=1628268 RepID=A0A812R8Y1_9DINO|nr:HERC1 [Symbiodinium necroappetens]
MAKQADQLATMVSSDLDQLRQALTRFLEISPDFRKASLSIGMEPQEQCVACRALPRKFVSDGATGADGSIYKIGADTVMSATEQTQKVLADKLRFPLRLSSSLFVPADDAMQSLFDSGIWRCRFHAPAVSRTMLGLIVFGLAVVLVDSSSEYIPPQVYRAGDYRHSFELRFDNSVWARGRNDFGQLGDGSVAHRETPVEVFINALQASAGEWHSLFLRNDGVVFACGRNDFGQLGEGTRVTRRFPMLIAKNIIAVSGGGYHSLLLRNDGVAQAMGHNRYGQLGDGSYVSKVKPVSVLPNVSAIAAAGHHSVFLRTDGSAWTVGRNHYGQLGDRTTVDKTTPIQVLDGVTSILARDAYSLFLLSNGSLVAAGDFDSGLPRSQTDWDTIQIFSEDEVQKISLDGCTGPTATSDATPVSAIQPLPLLRQMVVAESGWLTAKASAQEPERALQRKLVQSQEMPVQVATPRSKRRPPSAQEELRDRPQSVRSYFPAVDVRGSIPSGRRSR